MKKMIGQMVSAALLVPAMAAAAPTGLTAQVSSLPAKSTTKTASGTSNGVT